MQYKVFGCKVNKYYTDKWLNSEYLHDKTGTFVASCVVTDSAKRKWVRFVKKEVQTLELPAKVFISGCWAFKDGKAQDNFFDIYPELCFAREKIEVLDEAPPEEETKISVEGLLWTSMTLPTALNLSFSSKGTENTALLSSPEEWNIPKTKKAAIVWVSNINLSKLEALKKTQIYTRKYVLIQGGCDSFCTFCLTVQKRGKHFYRSAQDIASEIQEFADAGGKEAVLTGVNLAAWGLKNTYILENFSKDILKNGKTGGDKNRLAELLTYLLKHTTIPRLRISSIWPEFVNNNLLEVFAETRIIPHFHFSIQSGSNTILQAMARHYDGNYMRKLLKKMLTIPRKDGVSISIGADIIVGFPGETDKDFEDTMELIRDYNITKLHAFPFSAHTLGESVPAGKFQNQIPENTKKQRMSDILSLGEEVAKKFLESQKWKVLHVLVEKSNGTSFSWWTENYLEATQENFIIIEGLAKRNHIITGKFL